MIKNYPVQGFATGDVVPIVLIEMEKRLMPYQSRIVNTVHDSSVIDIHPDERDIVIDIIEDMNNGLNDLIEKELGVVMNVPLLLEAKIGPNWLDVQDV
jgi:DNA polymerase I-like protein with 3'-5' exonuclease and polymerase domains